KFAPRRNARIAAPGVLYLSPNSSLPMKHRPLSLPALAALFSFASPALLLAEEAKGESASSATTTMWQDLVSGGPVMIIIGICSPMIGLLGTVYGMKSAFRTLNVSGIGDPGKLSGAIGEVLICTAFGLLIAIPAFFAFYWLRNRAAKLIHNVQEMINSLYRRMPYEYLAGAHIGDEELYAAIPNWVQPVAERSVEQA